MIEKTVTVKVIITITEESGILNRVADAVKGMNNIEEIAISRDLFDAMKSKLVTLDEVFGCIDYIPIKILGIIPTIDNNIGKVLTLTLKEEKV